ncbi:MAG TPA: 2-C-methyl-D-erythritol 2,4-cyclodiphosphate synthase [Nitrospiria bacterium]|nr:2-C-methyl-D-erythritol 2,4-cyclodiphosphate synthase [Nitrospiria bacterium]
MIRVGIGYDVHRLVKGRPCIIGGVPIPFDLGLDGHSDADVLLHAISDALLGAAGLGDLGRYFPESDPKISGISSLRILERVVELLMEKEYRAVNVDSVVIAEKPRISQHVEEMRRNISKSVGIPEEAVNVKATTNERIGFIGRGEGIAAQAVCSIDSFDAGEYFGRDAR